MKQIGGLFDRIADARTLTHAAWRAARGKHERPEVCGFFTGLNAEVAHLAARLRAGQFRFSAYRSFPIRDPKTRLIHAPPFADRVVHHALIAVAGPVFESGASAHSYACRAGRGHHAALRQAQAWLRRTDWFLKLDVAKYYDSIPHALLRERLARRFREQRLLTLFDHLLASYENTPGHGLPIGALTSQYLGNFYLDLFDHWVNQSRHQRRYLRYMDDMLFLDTPAALRATHGAAAACLDGLGLRVKDGGVLNRAALGVPFLGFTLYPDRTRLNPPGRRRLRRKLKSLERAWEQGAVGEAELQARGEALFAHARFAGDRGWRQMVIRFSRLGETQEPATRPARRFVEQLGEELPGCQPQPEHARQPEQEHRLSGLSGSRHGGAVPPDDASSRARPPRGGRDQTPGKPPAGGHIQTESRAEPPFAGAPTGAPAAPAATAAGGPRP